MFELPPNFLNAAQTRKKISALGKCEALFCRRYSNNRSANSEPPGSARSAAYGASSRSLATTAVLWPLHIHDAVPCCAYRLGLNTNHEKRVGVDSLADVMIYPAKLSSISIRRMRRQEIDIRQKTVCCGLPTRAPATPAPLPLEHEYRGDRRRNGQKPLRDPCDEIDLVDHVHSPLIESIER